MGFPNPIKERLRNRFLTDYAKVLRDELDDFTKDSGITHRASVLSGRTSQVIIEVLPSDQPWIPEIAVATQDLKWLPNANATIEFNSPNKIIVTRPSEYLDEMLRWSNVQAWDDAGFVIGHILMAKK